MEKIGQGTFGVVYKGLWKDKLVAVKKLYFDDMEDAEFESFQSEVALMR
jgi:serine/threonine protein kinase